MRYEVFLSKRYAFTRRRENFITVISILSMLGVMVGTAALISVLSVFNGFSSVVTDLFVSFDPHIRVAVRSDDSVIKTSADFMPLLDSLKQFPEVAYAAPVVRSKCVLVHYTAPRVAVLTGIDAAKVRDVSGLGKSIQSGQLQLDGNSIVVGQLLADQLALIIGDTVRVFSPVGLENILTEPVQPRSKQLVVRGIFAANNREYDAINAYTNLDVARALADVPANEATSLDIKLHSINDANQVKTRLLKTIDRSHLTVETWYDLHQELYNVMKLERWIAYVILFLIVGVAAFNIFSSLTLTVFEKQRDIGLLRTLGAPARGIRQTYLLQGFLVGMIGTIVGCVLGLAIVLIQGHYGILKLDISVYIIPAIPVQLRTSDFIIVALGSLLLSTAGAFIPASRAARIEPAEAMRWE